MNSISEVEAQKISRELGVSLEVIRYAASEVTDKEVPEGEEYFISFTREEYDDIIDFLYRDEEADRKRREAAERYEQEKQEASERLREELDKIEGNDGREVPPWEMERPDEESSPPDFPIELGGERWHIDRRLRGEPILSPTGWNVPAVMIPGNLDERHIRPRYLYQYEDLG